jgi:hypothetical protein
MSSVATSPKPGPVITGDFDGDGYADLVIGAGQTVSAFHGQGSWLLGPPSVTEYSSDISGLGAGHVVSQQHDSLVVGTLFGECSLVEDILGKPSTVDSRDLDGLPPVQGDEVRCADVDDDGIDDVLIVNKGQRGAAILHGNGQSGFGPSVNSYAGGVQVVDIELGRIDSDRQLDLFMLDRSPSNIHLLRNRGQFWNNLGYDSGASPLGLYPRLVASGIPGFSSSFHIELTGIGSRPVLKMFIVGLGVGYSVVENQLVVPSLRQAFLLPGVSELTGSWDHVPAGIGPVCVQAVVMHLPNEGLMVSNALLVDY